MGRGRLAAIVAVCAFGLVGCPSDPARPLDAGSDARPGDAPAPTDTPSSDSSAPDATTTDDATSADGGLADGSAVDAGCACGASELCVRGVCLAACGATAAGLDGALATDLVPVAHYCRTPIAWSAVGDHVYEIVRRDEGMVVHFDLARWTATPGTSAPTPTMLATASYTRLSTDEMVFPPSGGYVAVSPDELHAVFGFTTDRSGFFGGVFDVATAGGAVVTTDAPGNFDAAFVSATRVIVNGGGIGTVTGQGLYELAAGTMGGGLVADTMGEYSGSLAYWASEDLLLAGGSSFGVPFPTGESERVFFVEPALLSTTSPANLNDDAEHLAAPSAFWLIPGGGLVSVVYDTSFALDHLEVRWLAVDTSGVPSASAPAALTNDDTFTLARTLGGDIGLEHTGGILVVRQVD